MTDNNSSSDEDNEINSSQNTLICPVCGQPQTNIYNLNRHRRSMKCFNESNKMKLNKKIKSLSLKLDDTVKKYEDSDMENKENRKKFREAIEKLTEENDSLTVRNGYAEDTIRGLNDRTLDDRASTLTTQSRIEDLEDKLILKRNEINKWSSGYTRTRRERDEARSERDVWLKIARKLYKKHPKEIESLIPYHNRN